MGKSPGVVPADQVPPPAGGPPPPAAGRAPSPQPGDAPVRRNRRRRPALRWVMHGVLFVALAFGVFALLPRIGGLAHDAAGLRHARPAFVVASVFAQAVSLACYALLYRRVLTSLGARVTFPLALRVTLASFLVSHVTPFGSATGTVLNVSTMEANGVAAATASEGIGLTSLVSSTALVALFGAGFVATAGRHLSQAYVTIAGVALALVVCVAATALLVGAHPVVAERAAGRAARLARHFRPSIDPDKAARSSGQLVARARSALTGRAFLASFAFAAGDLLFDLLSLDLMFLALRYQPGFGPLAVAYAAANIASAIPLTPGGLGVTEVTLVAITVGFGAPRATAVLAVLGYRLVNYWLPLLPGAIAYLHLRLRPRPAGTANSAATARGKRPGAGALK